MKSAIKVIDLFAGPGGLGEGFSQFKHNNQYPFQIDISVEKEESAHRTLTLRSFYRKFRHTETPEAYYEYLRNPDLGTEYLADKFPDEWASAVKETLGQPRELGSSDDTIIFNRLKEIKRSHNGPFVVIGGPPCQAYSVMGRIKNNSIEGYKAEDDHRNFLYKEYLKVIDLIGPEVFVMENVRGFITAKVNDQRMFPLILEDLKCPGTAVGNTKGKTYQIFSLSHVPSGINDKGEPYYESDQNFVIKSEKFGVPQSRHRVILLGVRSDIAQRRLPSILTEKTMTSTDQVLDGLPVLRSAVSRQKDNEELWRSTIRAVGLDLIEQLTSVNNTELVSHIENVLNTISQTEFEAGNKRYVKSKKIGLNNCSSELEAFYLDKKLKGHLNHFARSHMPSDLQRYLFCAAFAEKNCERRIPSPSKKDFLEGLAPNHKSWESGKFADRFRVQFRGSPSSTITSHINKDGHFFIHYDPKQCRSLTVREAARLQTFPDNYFFEGNMTQQFIQVGNAVPPYLAFQIASVVFSTLVD